MDRHEPHSGDGALPDTGQKNGNLHVAARERALAKILKAGESVFSRRGFDGATTAEIAREAGVAKATVHYYFKTKEDLYTGVLDRIHVIWEEALNDINADADPSEAFSRYIARKMRYSRQYPELTRLWMMEVLSGARRIEHFLRVRSRNLLDEKATVIRRWIADGKMDEVDPIHIFFMIWGMTQTYAETEVQMAMILGKDEIDDEVMRKATETISHVVLKGLGLTA
jgi:TetR/AcrR family transcriptional regulator